jgi:DNA mismatch repair ATPase MutS
MSHKIENSKIICLFKVVDKIEDQNISMAHSIAALNGLPMCIVQRATQV